MSDPHSPNPHAATATAATPQQTAPGAAHPFPVDAVEAAAHKVPVVLPVVGAIMIFLLAMIAVTMA